MGNTQYKTFEDNKHSIDDKIWLLERYLFSASKKAFFDSLVFSSEIYHYMYYSDFLNNPSEYEVQETRRMLEKEYLTGPENCLRDEIKFKKLCQDACETKSLSERKKIFRLLNQLYFREQLDKGFAQKAVKKDVGATGQKSDQAEVSASQRAIPEVPEDVLNKIEKYPYSKKPTTLETERFRVLLKSLNLYLLASLDLNIFCSADDWRLEQVIDVLRRAPTGILASTKGVENALVCYQTNSKKSSAVSTFIEQCISQLPLSSLEKLKQTSIGLEHKFFLAILPCYQREPRAKVELVPDLGTFKPCPQVKTLQALVCLWKAESGNLDAFCAWLDLANQGYGPDILIDQVHYHLVKDHRNKRALITDRVRELSTALRNSEEWPSQKQTYLKVLETQLLKKPDDYSKLVSKLSAYFDKESVEKEIALILLAHGHKPPSLNAYFKEAELAEMRENRTIELSTPALPSSGFNSVDSSELVLTTCNISTVEIAVYSIDLKDLYLRGRESKVSPRMDIRGFTPNKILVRKYKASGGRKFTETLKMSEAVSRQGTYLVEARGEGKSSRALVTIGGLALVTVSQSLEEHVFQMMTKQGEVCKHGSSVYFGKKQYQTRNDGLVRVPTVQLLEHDTKRVGLESEDDHFLVSSLSLNLTNPSLSCSIIANPCGVYAGSSSRFLIRPLVKISSDGSLHSIGSGKRVKLTVVYTGVNSASSETQALLTNQQGDLEVNCSIPAQAQQIGLKVESSWKERELHWQGEIELKRPGDDPELRITLGLVHLTKGMFKIEVRGKNGECYPKQEVTLNIKRRAFSSASTLTELTDSEGNLVVGPYFDATTISASARTLQASSTWNIYSETIQPSVVTISADRAYQFEVKVPVLPRSMCPAILTRIRSQSSPEPLSIESSKLTFQEANERCTLVTVKGLQPGWYLLVTAEDSQQRFIEVVEDQSRPEGVVKTTSGVQALSKPAPIVTWKVCEAEGSAKVSLIHSAKSTPVAYAIFSQYSSTEVQSSTFEAPQSAQEFSGARASFSPDSELPKEVQYTLDRRNLEPFVGNTLQKPTSLLNPKAVRQTTSVADNTSITQESTDYQEEKKSQATADFKKKPPKKPEVSKKELVVQPEGYRIKDRGLIEKIELQQEEGGYFANVNLKTYRQCQIIFLIEDQSPVYSPVLPCPEAREVESRDFRLSKARDSSIVSFETREILAAKQQTPVGESSACRPVSTLSELFRVLCHLSKTADLQENWGFLPKWSSLTVKQQLMLYDKFNSNELHFYLYFKDKEFTSSVVAPYIANKNKKGIIDYLILKDVNGLKRHFNNVAVSHMSAMEITMLVIGLCEEEAEACSNLVSKLRQQYEEFAIQQTEKRSTRSAQSGGRKFRKFDIEEYNKKFDSVLDLKSEEVAEGENEETTDSKQDKEVSLITKYLKVQVDQCGNRLGTEYVPQVTDGVQNFNTMGVTDEVIERGYLLQGSNFDLSEFWIEFLEYVVKNKQAENFMSNKWIGISQGECEVIAALSVIDIPDCQISGVTRAGDAGWKSNSDKDVYFVKREFVSKQAVSSENQQGLNSQTASLVLTQKIFDYCTNQEVQTLHPGTAYTLKTIAMNCNDSQVQGTLITQIPEAAVRLRSSLQTEHSHIVLEPFKVVQATIDFYYPDLHPFVCYPACVASNGQKIAQSSNFSDTFKTEQKEEKNYDEVLEQLNNQSANELSSINLKEVYPKLVDEEFYQKIIQILRKRFEFDYTVWSFSLYHGDLEGAREFLKLKFHNQAIRINQFDIFYFKNDLFDVDYFNFREYIPLTNPRIHDISQYKHNIINRDFLNTYYVFLKYFQDKGRFDNKDLISLTIYNLMQDRVKDAIAVFRRIEKGSIGEGCEMSLQFDYLDGYLRFYEKDFAGIKKISQKYLLYPVISWRNRFCKMMEQVLEHEELQVKNENQQNAEELSTRGGYGRGTHKVEIREQDIYVESSGISELVIDYYEVDLELLFSTNPKILLQDSDIEVPVKANFSETKEISTKQTNRGLNSSKFSLPADLSGKDLLIKVKDCTASAPKVLKYYAHRLEVSAAENFGLLKVTKDGMHLPKCYVKCLRQETAGGDFKFFKDGYTDIRGNFDYASLNAGELSSIKKFAILLVTPQQTSTLITVDPPSRVIPSSEMTAELGSMLWRSSEAKRAAV